MGKEDKEKAKQEKEEKARREKEEKEREKCEKEESIKREKEEKEREKREKKEKKDRKETVPEKPPSPHQPEEKTNNKPVVLKPITIPVETKPAPKPAGKPVAKPAQAKPAPKPAAKSPETRSMPVKPVSKPAATKPASIIPVAKSIQATPAPKPAENPVVFKTKISMVGAKPITRPGEPKSVVPKPAIKSTEPKPVPKPVERRPTPPPIPSAGTGTQLSLPKWIPDIGIEGAADSFAKKLGSGILKGDEDAVLFLKAMLDASKQSQQAKKKEKKEFARYIAEDLDQYTDVAYLFEIRGWKEKYLLLFTPESMKLGMWEGKFDVPPVNIGGIKVTNCMFFEMTPPKMLETMKGNMEEHLPISSGEVTAIGSVRLAQMFREWIQTFLKFIGQVSG